MQLRGAPRWATKRISQGRRRLARETEEWNRLVAAMGAVLKARPEEA